MADPRYNAAWRMAEQWKQRMGQQRPSQGMSGFKMLGAWLLFGMLLLVGTLFALFFLVIGWALMPLLRYKMKKRAERFSHTYEGQASSKHGSAHYHHVLEGEYEAKPSPRR
ncbi:hypothetical protein [Phytohalomonas tamaricis]|uniref:hypothetical protein n=1 Tax=Phytohalomonas tamaricis TaxID=2081032 RepID=UPI000D0B886D|nr:hypothetical protein [Phytohalomonas tamaricis]